MDIYDEFEAQYCSCCEACGQACSASEEEMVMCNFWLAFLAQNGLI